MVSCVRPPELMGLRALFALNDGLRRRTFSCLLVCPSSLHAQNAQDPSNAPSIRVNSSMVNVYAIVEDWRGRLVRTLSKQDFEVTENKDPQEIVYFSRETDPPLSLGLLIDTSSSQERLLSTEQKAAKMFLNSVLRKTDQAFFMRSIPTSS